MECAVEFGSGAMIYTKFNKDWFSHSVVIGWGVYTYRQTDSKVISYA
jgi:hypothetical protein